MFRVLLSPRLIGLHLLAVVAITTAVWLGLWQYDAWQTRREAQAIDLADVPSKPLDAVMSSDDPYPGEAIGQPVTFEGRWLPDETFYVRRAMDDRAGYWAVTPVQVSTGPDTGPGAGSGAGAPAVLVVRGWIQDRGDDPGAPDGEAEISGRLQPPEGSGVTDQNVRDDVLPQLRIASVVQRIDRDLYGAYVVSTGSTTRDGSTTRSGSTTGDGSTTGGGETTGSGLQPVTPESVPEPSAFTALRNLLYAVEWWVFGAFAAFLWWRWCRDEVVRAGSPPEQGEPQGTQSAEVASTL